eukprot:3476190-Pleurochrysis_carterae.AAC.1
MGQRWSAASSSTTPTQLLYDPQPGGPTRLHQEEDPKPKRTAASLAIGGCSKEKLSKLANKFMVVLGKHLRVCGDDGSCWLYSILGAFGDMEHTGVQITFFKPGSMLPFKPVDISH